MSAILPIIANDRSVIRSATVAGQKDFTFDFPVQAAGDLAVAAALSATSSVFTSLSLAAGDFTVSGIGEASGGTITLTNGRGIGDRVWIAGKTDLTRVQSITRAGKFRSAAVDADLDRMVMIAQELRRDVDTLAGRGLEIVDAAAIVMQTADHLVDTANPHAVTKAQVGLGNVDNISDANKAASGPIADAIATRLAKTGGIVTGNVTVKTSWASLNIDIPNNTTSGQLVFQIADAPRWVIAASDDLSIGRWASGGAWIGNALTVSGSTGDVTLNAAGGRLRLGPTSLETYGASDGKGTAAQRISIKLGTSAAPTTSVEPASRLQVTTAVNVYNASAPDGNKGLSNQWSVLGGLRQYVINAGTFDKVVGDLHELYSYAPNGGEHITSMWLATAAANRVPNTSPNGWAPRNGVGDLWCGWFRVSDGGFDSNGIAVEINSRSTNRVRLDTSYASVPLPDGFQILVQLAPDWSTYHPTRAISIMPTPPSAGRPFAVGFQTGIFVSGHVQYGIIFGDGIPYYDPQNQAGSATSPVDIDFAGNTLVKMRIRWSDVPMFDIVKETNFLVFRRDASHYFMSFDTTTYATKLASGRITISDAGSLGLWSATPPAAKPTVSGSRGSNAALASLLTALVSYGLVTDTTT